MSIQTNRTALAAAIASVATLAGLAQPACGDFYQFTFGGEIHTVDGMVPEPWDAVHVGSEFEFSYIFDSEAEDHVPMSWAGRYDIVSATLTMEEAAQTTYAGEILLLNLGVDDYFVYFWDLPIGADAGVHLSGWDILESDELLLDIDLDQWDGKSFGFTGVGPDGVYEVRGSIISFTGQVVPGPGTWAIPLLICLAAVRRRR